MRNKYYILALTFLCLLCGQMSFGFGGEGNYGDEDDWGGINIIVYDDTNIHLFIENHKDDLSYEIESMYNQDDFDLWLEDASELEKLLVTIHTNIDPTDGSEFNVYRIPIDITFNPDDDDQEDPDQTCDSCDCNPLFCFGGNPPNEDDNDSNNTYDGNYDTGDETGNTGPLESGCDITSCPIGYVKVVCECVVMDIYDTTYVISSYDFEHGKNNVFSSSGRPLRSGDAGNLIQIEINGQLYKLSELDPKKPGTVSALNKIAAFYAKEKGYIGLVITTASIGDKGGRDAAFYGNGALTIRSVAFADGKFDNIYDLKSTINHEVLHWKDPRTVSDNYNFMDHANIYLQEASDPDFNKTSDRIKINNANQYMIRVLNASQSGMVGMNNAGVIAAFDKYNKENKGGIKIYNYLFSAGGITKLIFDISIDGVYKPNNEYKYEELTSPRG